jgi:transposase
MYIRQTKTRSAKSGENYFTFRLVASVRVGSKVKQRTLLNLGSNFSLSKDLWPRLCSRIDQLLAGQSSLLSEITEIEELAQHYAARLLALDAPVSTQQQGDQGGDYQEVDVSSLELIRPRSVGVEHVGVAALTELGLPQILKDAGLNGVQCSAALGSIIGRMAAPGSELATLRWLKERSALGDLLDVDFATLSSMRLYRTSDLLIRHRESIETALFGQIQTLFSLPDSVTLFDLTNTYFEGEMTNNAKTQRGRSKEKRSDCPLVTLGLVLDGSGFVRRSKMFAGNVSEATTLEEMLDGLETPTGALVIMDAGIATQANIDWLVEHQYRYLVVSRERHRQFEETQVVETTTASQQAIQIQRVPSEDGKEVRLYCHSAARQEKEVAMTTQFALRFEAGLTKIAAGLDKKRCEKRLDKLWERIGRLKAQSHGIGQHYTITLTPDETGTKAIALSWEKRPVNATMMTHPGVYCLRTNELNWDEATLWKTYTMLTDLEAVFRSLKSELGLRPVYHHKEERTEGHLFITVLAYQAVQVLRKKLKTKGITESWLSLRQTLSVQQRVTATFKQRDGHTLHVRKATVAEPKLQELYAALGLSPSPGGIQKSLYLTE